MKRNTLKSLIFLLCVFTINAQKIEVEDIFGGYRFTQNGQEYSIAELSKLMKPNPKAYEYISSAESGEKTAVILGSIGGALIGWPIGTAIGGGEANWTLAAIGAGFVGIAIPFATKANSNAIKAVNIYNSDQETAFKTELKFQLYPNGIGFALSF
jgi:hypothetical protein